MTGWHSWARVQRWEGFITLVFIRGISLSKHHDIVDIVVVLNNERTFPNLHNSFKFFPSLVLPMQQCVTSCALIFVHILL